MSLSRAEIDRLATHPQERRVIMIREGRRYRGIEAAAGLLAKARGHRVDRPDRASRWAALAWLAAEGLPGVEGARLRALAAAEDGNAQRLCGHWRSAESRFALAHSQLGTGMEPERLEVQLLEASLATQREQWIRVWTLLQSATETARRLGDSGALYRALSKRGIACTDTGHYVEAVRLFVEAVEVAEDRPALRLEALHNAVAVYAEAGWPRDGMERYQRIAPYYSTLGPLWQGRAAWLRGRLEGQLGRHDESAASLRAARETIAEHRRYWELAEILCDEAEAMISAGQVEGVAELAGVARQAFEAVGLGRRAARAAGLMRSAAAMGGFRAIATVRGLLRDRRTLRGA